MPLTKKEMKKFMKGIMRNFGPPFLPLGSVNASIMNLSSSGDCISIRIGRRDVTFDSNMNDIEAGTMMTEDPFPEYGEDGKIKKGQKFMKPKKKK
jgi:hypothetical protein